MVRRRFDAGNRSNISTAVSRSAYPVAAVSSASTIKALRFSINR
jgi:hypothetical protein